MGSSNANHYKSKVTLIITSQEQVVSAVAGKKCTPPCWKLNIVWHYKFHLGMTKRRGDAVVCQEAFGKGQGGKVALLVKPEQKLWSNIDNLRKGFSQSVNENREKFYLMAVFLQPQYRQSGTISVLRKGTIGWFFLPGDVNVCFRDRWKYCETRQTVFLQYECLALWPMKVLQS